MYDQNELTAGGMRRQLQLAIGPGTKEEYEYIYSHSVKPVDACWPMPKAPGWASSPPVASAPVVDPSGRLCWMKLTTIVEKSD